MSLDSEVAALTRVTTQLLSEVNVTSSSLSDKATTASNEASSAAGRVPTAEGYKDQAFQHSSDAKTLANNARDAVSYSLLPEGVTDSIVTNDLADIFVYDTTKDSDGGAWRYRTQEKSWHDEADAPTGTWLGAHEDENSARLANLRTGPELLTNGDFESDLSGYTLGNTGGGMGWIWQDGKAVIDASGLYRNLEQNVLEVGKSYAVTFEKTQGDVYIYYNLGLSSFQRANSVTNGRITFYLDAVNAAAFVISSSTIGTTLDNVSVKEITDYGSDLVTNGKFGSDISGWADDSAAGGSIAWNSSGYLSLAATTGTSRASQSINTTAGSIYFVSLEVISLNGSTSSALYLDGVQQGGSFTAGTTTSVYVATGSSVSVGVRNFTTGTTVYIDNISVREVDLQTAAGDYYHNSSDYYFYKLNALGTSPTRVYRGSRKEFPSTAVIVADNAANYSTNSRVVIYDGDDPTLPMWMMFLGSWSYASGTMLIIASGGASTPITSVAMLNGKLCVGSNHSIDSTSGLHVIDFLQDRARLYRGGSTYNTFTNHAGIVERNDAKGVLGVNDSSQAISHGRVNDIAMTVLPNAPIDDATGLPIPTIAVAVGVHGSANGGTSVIRDDGTVVDILANAGAGGYAGYEVTFSPEGDLFTTQAYNRGYAYFHAFYNLPTADLAAASTYQTYARTYIFSASAIPSVRGTVVSEPFIWGLTYAGEAVAVALGDKLSLLHEDKSDKYNLSGSMVNYTNAYYTTGWLNGDIKLATLADTDSTSLVDTELILNGGFGDSSNWTALTGTLSISNGQLTVVSGDRIQQDLDVGETITNRVYQATSETGTVSGFYTSSGGKSYKWSLDIVAVNTVGKLQILFTNNDKFEIKALSSGEYIVDNASVVEIVDDRSFKDNGLEVNGTMSRSAVATGAELVAYDTFTSSNYLSQPYNSDLDFAGDFSVSCWFKTTETGLRYIFQRNSDPASHRYFAYVQDNYLKFAWNGNGTSSTLTVESPYAVNDGLWKLFSATRSGDVFSLYLDGVLVDTTTDANAGSFANTSAVLTIGATTTASSTFASGSLALFRISGTALTADQAKKLYEDEKHLFQENAKCTLYGTSSEVKAVGYDKGTGLLHAGTSEGRSSFDGLVRVDEKAGNVGNVISAANGLVVEG